jgi:hypothetical protein
MKIFEVIEDTDTIYVTRSESKACEKALLCEKEHVWIVEMIMDSYPHQERVWNDLDDFRKEYSV